MNFIDKNQTHEPPSGYKCVHVQADGSFLRVRYRQDIYRRDTIIVIAQNIVEVFLNDMGREVARTQIRVETPPIADPIPAPVGRRYKIWNGILLILQDIQEMFQ